MSAIAEAASNVKQNSHTFVQLARQYAEDETGITADDVTDACLADDKQVSDFEQLVRTCRTRQQMRDERAGVGPKQEEINRLTKQIEEANRKREAAQAEHRDAVRPLYDQKQMLQQQIANTVTIPNQLADKCPCPDLKRQAAWLRSRGQVLERELTAAQRHLHNQETFRGNEAYRQAVRNSDKAKVKKFEGRITRAAEALAVAEQARSENAAEQNDNWQARVDY